MWMAHADGVLQRSLTQCAHLLQLYCRSPAPRPCFPPTFPPQRSAAGTAPAPPPRPAHLHEVQQLHPGVLGDGALVVLLEELAPRGHVRPPRLRHQQLPHGQRHIQLHALVPLLPAPQGQRSEPGSRTCTAGTWAAGTSRPNPQPAAPPCLSPIRCAPAEEVGVVVDLAELVRVLHLRAQAWQLGFELVQRIAPQLGQACTRGGRCNWRGFNTVGGMASDASQCEPCVGPSRHPADPPATRALHSVPHSHAQTTAKYIQACTEAYPPQTRPCYTRTSHPPPSAS